MTDSKRNSPLMSVIIPTACKRAELLRRAVGSAISGFSATEVEVIVVANGRGCDGAHLDQELAAFADYVRILHLDAGNVSAARNHGLLSAKGRLVRFLDDDDFLFHDVAVTQCRELIRSGADFSSYALVIQDEKGIPWQTVRQYPDNDPVVAHLSRAGPQLPVAHLFRTDVVRSLRWREDYPVVEDVAWIHSVLAARETAWLRSDLVVGAWYQHRGSRLSPAFSMHHTASLVANSMMATVAALDAQGRLTTTRRQAVARGLWNCVHSAFFLRPWFWHKMARTAQEWDLRSHPDDRFFESGIGRHLSPLLVEWVMVPKRLLNWLSRRVMASLQGIAHVRRL